MMRMRESVFPKVSLTRFAWLSIAAALATIALKMGAWLLTGSVGLLSDALESLVNLAGAVMALAMLTISARPADDDHAFGHGKAEYFSSGAEGVLIIVAAAGIVATAVNRLLHPQPLEQVGLGLVVSVAASLINLGVARVLLRTAREHRSITLEADARHLLTDVWTSVGVLVGLGAVLLTGWQVLDPVIALGVAVNIVWTGVRIIRESVAGLMDETLPPEEIAEIERVLASFREEGIGFERLLTHRAGAGRFVSVCVLVPGHWTVCSGHQMLDRVEEAIQAALPGAAIITHLEALEGRTASSPATAGAPAG
jgi:cation diffusion facilitator family transporter